MIADGVVSLPHARWLPHRNRRVQRETNETVYQRLRQGQRHKLAPEMEGDRAAPAPHTGAGFGWGGIGFICNEIAT